MINQKATFFNLISWEGKEKGKRDRGALRGKEAFNRFVEKGNYKQSSLVVKVRLSLNGWTIELWQDKNNSLKKIPNPEIGHFHYATSTTSIAEKVRKVEKEHNFINSNKE